MTPSQTISSENIDAAYDKLHADTEWLLKTLKWLGTAGTSGGITTCNRHRGCGFTSDCEICKKVKEIEKRLTIKCQDL